MEKLCILAVTQYTHSFVKIYNNKQNVKMNERMRMG